MKGTLIALAVGAVLASTGASAGTTVGRDVGFVPVQYVSQSDERAMSINERESHLRNRIERGMHDGRITNREARMLLRQLERIEAREHSYMADGRLNRREDAQLKRDLDQLSLNVRTQLRDEDRRVSAYDQYGRPITR
jgi:hypothetical protein